MRRSGIVVRPAWLLAAAFLAIGPLAASAQDKPIATTTLLQRLPAPQRVTVRQTSGGEITLSWAPVAGAKSYVIGRAVGTEGFRRMLDASTAPDTVYVDRRIVVGTRHVYTVTPISTADVSGIRATSDSIVPTATVGPTTTTTTTTAASIVARQAGATDIAIQWQGTGGSYRYYLKPVLDDVPKALVALSESYVVQRNVAPGRHRFELLREPFLSSTKTVVATSEVVTIGTTSTGSTEVPTTSTTAPPSGTTVLVPAAPAVALRVGATLPLGPGQWTSLAPGIASVGADGTVTGRAAGTAPIVALAVQSDGAVRVTVVRVAVQP
jgi:hypothetical protein